jgi:hypothetical protein
MNANIQSCVHKRTKLLTILARVCWPSNGLCFEKKKGRAGRPVAVVEAQGTTVSLNAGWFMLLTRCPLPRNYPESITQQGTLLPLLPLSLQPREQQTLACLCATWLH